MSAPLRLSLYQRWTRIFYELYVKSERSALFTVASSLSYTTILSIVPFLAVSLSIFQILGGMEKFLAEVEPFILSHLAYGTSKEVIGMLQNFISNAHSAAVGIGGTIGLLVTSMSLLYNVENAIHQIWQTANQRGIAHRIMAYWLIIILGPIGLSVALGIFSSMKGIHVLHMIPSGAGFFAISVGIFFLIYKLVPQVVVKPRYALTSAFFTSVLWAIAQLGFRFYTTKIVSYDNIYGSLGAVPILLLWIYVVWVLVLGGAALTAILQSTCDGEKAPAPLVPIS